MTARLKNPGAGEAGFILLGVLVIEFVLAIMGAAFLSLTGGETKSAQVNLDSQRAFWLAEAGRNRAICYLDQLSNPPAADRVIYQDVPGPDGGTYTVTCFVDPSGTWSADKPFTLDCLGTFHGVQRHIRQRVQMVSFARYAYFTNAETHPTVGDIWFTSTDVIEGATHTNDTFHVYGDPHFRGVVTSSSDHMTGYPNFRVTTPGGWPVGGSDPTFDQGFELNVASIPLPTQTDDLRVTAQNGGIYINAEAQIEIGKRGTSSSGSGSLAAGWLRYRPTSPSNSSWSEVSISSLSKKVVYGNNNLHLQPYSTSTGTLTGELTIASNRSVLIENDVRYTTSDATGAPLSTCKDLLGIVAATNVIFADNTQNNSGMIIDASLMALNTCIQAENYDERPVSTLTIYGGLIQQYRGPVCLIRNGSIIHGFRKNYHYDTRLTAKTPPGFPQTGIYEEIAWEESWDESDPY